MCGFCQHEAQILKFAHLKERWCLMGHETLWIPQHFGTTAPPGHRPPAARAEFARGRSPGAGVSEFSLAVAERLAAWGRGGLGPQAGRWAPPEIDHAPTRSAAAGVAEWRPDVWLPQRALDLEAYR